MSTEASAAPMSPQRLEHLARLVESSRKDSNAFLQLQREGRAVEELLGEVERLNALVLLLLMGMEMRGVMTPQLVRMVKPHVQGALALAMR